MNWLSLRDKWLRFKTSGRLPIVLEESIEEYTSMKPNNPKDVNIDIVTGLDLGTLGSRPIMPKMASAKMTGPLECYEHKLPADKRS